MLYMLAPRPVSHTHRSGAQRYFHGIIVFMSTCGPNVFGADPATIKWNVVRGDTAPLRIEFFEDDEVTYYDTTGWTYKATAYDPKTDILDELEVTEHDGYIDIKATEAITQYWGDSYSRVTAELLFDVQVTTSDSVWTPVIGTIYVLGDVTGGSI